MRTVRTIIDLRRTLDDWRAEGQSIALVPTMGALHAGHLSLVDLAKGRAQRVIASLFVNPRQFGPNDDLSRYPRDEARDAGLLQKAGVDLLFAHEPGVMYPPDAATTISLAGPTLGMEGDHREGFFAGVATIVAKLLLQSGCDHAIFGEKDYQQLVVVRRMVADLDIRTEIVAAPTMREEDGLAMSSRNAYLSGDERSRATALYATLTETAASLTAGNTIADALLAGREALNTRFDGLDYLELRDAATLAAVDRLDRPCRLLAAVRLGTTRLIDNVALEAKS